MTEKRLEGQLEQKNKFGHLKPTFWRLEAGYLASYPSSTAYLDGKAPGATFDLARDVKDITRKGDSKTFSVFTNLRDGKVITLRAPTRESASEWIRTLQFVRSELRDQLLATGSVYRRASEGGLREQLDWKTALTTERYLTAANLTDAEREEWIESYIEECYKTSEVSCSQAASRLECKSKGTQFLLADMLTLAEEYDLEVSCPQTDLLAASQAALEAFCSDFVIQHQRLVFNRILTDMGLFLSIHANDRRVNTSNTWEELSSVILVVTGLNNALRAITPAAGEFRIDIRPKLLDEGTLTALAISKVVDEVEDVWLSVLAAVSGEEGCTEDGCAPSAVLGVLSTALEKVADVDHSILEAIATSSLIMLMSLLNKSENSPPAEPKTVSTCNSVVAAEQRLLDFAEGCLSAKSTLEHLIRNSWHGLVADCLAVEVEQAWSRLASACAKYTARKVLFSGSSGSEFTKLRPLLFSEFDKGDSEGNEENIEVIQLVLAAMRRWKKSVGERNAHLQEERLRAGVEELVIWYLKALRDECAAVVLGGKKPVDVQACAVQCAEIVCLAEQWGLATPEKACFVEPLRWTSKFLLSAGEVLSTIFVNLAANLQEQELLFFYEHVNVCLKLRDASCQSTCGAEALTNISEILLQLQQRPTPIAKQKTGIAEAMAVLRAVYPNAGDCRFTGSPVRTFERNTSIDRASAALESMQLIEREARADLEGEDVRRETETAREIRDESNARSRSRSSQRMLSIVSRSSSASSIHDSSSASPISNIDAVTSSASPARSVFSETTSTAPSQPRTPPSVVRVESVSTSVNTSTGRRAFGGGAWGAQEISKETVKTPTPIPEASAQKPKRAFGGGRVSAPLDDHTSVAVASRPEPSKPAAPTPTVATVTVPSTPFTNPASPPPAARHVVRQKPGSSTGPKRTFAGGRNL